MMANSTLARDVAAETVIAADMVEPPKESLLWRLRRKLEEAFGLS
jgi:predicted homoserine dehydrogenase-like protein